MINLTCYDDFINENTAEHMAAVMKVNDIKLIKHKQKNMQHKSNVLKRKGKMKDLIYAAYYKNGILIAYGRKMYKLYKDIFEFIAFKKKLVNTEIVRCFEYVKKFDSHPKLSDYDMYVNDQSYSGDFAHRYASIDMIKPKIADISFKYLDHSCTLSVMSKKDFKDFTYSLNALDKFYNSVKYNFDKLEELDMHLKMLKLHDIGIFDD